MSRQADWQRQKRAEGKCAVCGEAEWTAGYCQRHHEARIARVRERRGSTVLRECTYCGKEGHNRRGCGARRLDEEAGIHQESRLKAPVGAVPRVLTCSVCGIEGHNQRTCSERLNCACGHSKRSHQHLGVSGCTVPGCECLRWNHKSG